MKIAFNPTADLGLFTPEIFLAILGVVVLGIAVTSKKRYPLAAPVVALLGLLVCLPLAAELWRHDEKVIFLGSYAVDDLAVFFKLIAITIGGLVILASVSFMRRAEGEYGEFFALVVWGVLGLCLMAGASDLIVIILSIEMVSILSYVMTGYFRREPRSSEASLKYFLFGAAASAIMLYGLTLLYGIAGTTKIYGLFGDAGLAGSLDARPSLLQPIAAMLVLAGLGFKIAMVPFHWWAPDAYEGAPTPVTAFLSVGPKAAGFALIARLFMHYDNAIYPQWPLIVAWLATATMFIGNWTAIWQTNIKRMLAYSSIAHAGYMLIGIVAWKGAAWGVEQPGGAYALHGGLHAVMFYLAAYLFMNMGAFAVAIAVEQATGSASLDQYQGLAQRAPFLALAMAIFLLSLSGIPPLAGFFGKYYVFNAAIRNEQFVWLAVVGAVNSIIAVYYYMNVVRLMYFRQPRGAEADETPVRLEPAAGLQSVVIIALVVTILLGILPNPLVRFLSESILPGGLS